MNFIRNRLGENCSTPSFTISLFSDLVPLSLDPETAHQSLSMCEEKGVVCSTECQAYLDQPERFDWWAQVLCREPLNARCYWEAEWTGLHGVDVAVSYRDIQRKGDNDECSFGYNKQSWSLDCAILKYAFAHDKVEKEISAPVSHRIGVYLDYKVGVLSFYSVSDCMTLLHREETRFTQPLYAGFGLYEGSTVRICQPDIEAMEKIPKESRAGWEWTERGHEEINIMGSSRVLVLHTLIWDHSLNRWMDLLVLDDDAVFHLCQSVQG